MLVAATLAYPFVGFGNWSVECSKSEKASQALLEAFSFLLNTADAGVLIGATFLLFLIPIINCMVFLASPDHSQSVSRLECQ